MVSRPLQSTEQVPQCQPLRQGRSTHSRCQGSRVGHQCWISAKRSLCTLRQGPRMFKGSIEIFCDRVRRGAPQGDDSSSPVSPWFLVPERSRPSLDVPSTGTTTTTSTEGMIGDTVRVLYGRERIRRVVGPITSTVIGSETL